ncbi:MAG: TRAP transporter small permease subunit [Burkholderiales bacterium]|nr:TRAP transporter small permease subunit [Burkholderiales bacterium]
MSVTSGGFLAATAGRLDAITFAVGRRVAYLIIATVLVCFANVYLRYSFDVGYVWLQEAYIWTHVLTIMFGSSFALLQGGFVRVDIFYNRMSSRNKAWVDLFGSIFFAGPFLWMAAASGWAFFAASWRMGERSAYDSGLPATYVLKGTLLFFVLLLGIQVVAIALRCVLTLLGYERPARPAVYEV